MGKCLFMRKGETHTVPTLGLPSGYTELMYIESSGTQYIDTGFNPNQDSCVVLDAQMLEGSAPTKTKIYFGCRSGGKYFEIYKASSSGQTLHFLYNTGVGGEYSVDYTLRRTVEINKNVATVDGISKEATYATFQIGRTIFIGADNNDGTPASITSIRIYTCQIYDNGTIVRDFVPCVNPDGEIGLYDRVTKTFFGNAGTGYFSGMDLDGNVVTASIKASTLAVGSTVKLNENGSPVEYLVVHNGLPSSIYDVSCDGLWLLRKDIYEKREWNNTSTYNRYPESSIHKYLNSTFLNLFDDITKETIRQVKIPSISDAQQNIILNGANGLTTKVFLLAAFELGATKNTNLYVATDGAKLDYFATGSDTNAKSLRVGYYNGSVSNWNTRTPMLQEIDYVWCVLNSGDFDFGTYGASVGVRPALILPSTAVFDADTMILRGWHNG